MALEQRSEQDWRMSPGPVDGHTHPRAFDPRLPDSFNPINEGWEGKAGLRGYTEVVLSSGITAMIAMPNESLRIVDPEAQHPDKTILIPYPISNLDRVRAFQALIHAEAVIPTGIFMGVDPAEIYRDEAKQQLNVELLHERFSSVKDECVGLKLYLDETTGGYNIAAKHARPVIQAWHQHNPDKPVVLHAEGKNVLDVLAAINMTDKGREILIHIAHISSREELEAVIIAKTKGMRVTCEVTLHHLTLVADEVMGIGNYGCVKPNLKTLADIEFIRTNLRYIDTIASDGAPHRKSEKESKAANWGMTGHTLLIPVLLGMVEEGKLTMQDLYDKLCLNPRRIFNLPLEDKSWIDVKVGDDETVAELARAEERRFGYQPYSRIDKAIRLGGRVLFATGGVSAYYAHDRRKVSLRARPSYLHLIRPKNTQES